MLVGPFQIETSLLSRNQNLRKRRKILYTCKCRCPTSLPINIINLILKHTQSLPIHHLCSIINLNTIIIKVHHIPKRIDLMLAKLSLTPLLLLRILPHLHNKYLDQVHGKRNLVLQKYKQVNFKLKEPVDLRAILFSNNFFQKCKRKRFKYQKM